MSGKESGKITKSPTQQNPVHDFNKETIKGEEQRKSAVKKILSRSSLSLNPAEIIALQKSVGNQTVQRFLVNSPSDRQDVASKVVIAQNQLPLIQRDDDEERYVQYEILGRSRAPAERFRAILQAAIPANQQNGIALRMIQVLPAVAAILDEYLSVQSRSEILDQSSPSNPGYYGSLELSTGDANALWDFYKARWESEDASTRRAWLRLGQRRITQLILPWSTQRYIPQSHRQSVRNYIDQLIRQRIATLRQDQNFAVLSSNGAALDRPIIVTPPTPRATRHRSRGPRERLLTPQETGELYEVDDLNSPVTADEIEQARHEIQIDVISERMDQFVNTDILAPMPVRAGNRPNIRTEAFAQLITLLRQQAELEAEIDQQSQSAPGTVESTGSQPAESPELTSLRQRLATLRTQISAQSTQATEIALRWYRGREAAVGQDVEATQPQASARQRLPRATTARGSRGVRMFYIRRAIQALVNGQLLRRYRRVHYRGTVAGRQIELRPASLGHKVDRPEGHVAGGPGYHEGLLEQRVQQSGLPAERHPLALHILGAFRQLEGQPQSLNTWDSAVLTLGSGIAARGQLQIALSDFKQANPQGFRALFGRFGLDVYGRELNWNFSLRVPRQPISEGYTPGELLEGERAVEYIANDPVLLVQLRRAGHSGAWQSFLIDRALASVRRALTYSYGTMAWSQYLRGVPEALVEGTYFALANNIHASNGTGDVTAALDREWERIQQATGLRLEQLATADSAQDSRQRMAVAAALAAASNRRRGFIAQVPALAQYLP